ncbi:M15 family metallopeptidase [Pseudoalteromonas fenneropenaei]|uniref:D-alanyl-D-alanine dipeptidase n=1 Tax=Pseudoalteromonas fenneropenaei TaxID=1737459 RepID=A0ABV7CG07_9GAMM
MAKIAIVGLWLAVGMAANVYADTATKAPNFVDAKKHIPDLDVDMRYYSENNFIGARIDGYQAPLCLLTESAASALKQAHTRLKTFGLRLKVFDCYRPQQAVDHFARWAKDSDDTKMKAQYYPDVPKSLLFARGYIAERSGHSRGSTVDATIIDSFSGRELDMGSSWDFFSKISWPSYPYLTVQQRTNRALLAATMAEAGFTGLSEEWWHFSLNNEPYPEDYFNVAVSPSAAQ